MPPWVVYLPIHPGICLPVWHTSLYASLVYILSYTLPICLPGVYKVVHTQHSLPGVYKVVYIPSIASLVYIGWCTYPA